MREGDLVLRSSLIARSDLNPATAALHDIPRGKNRALLKVALLRASDEKSVRATVTAASRNQRGERQKILRREVLHEGDASYIGSFEFAPREELQFVVEARPAERKDRKPLSMSYVERMPPD